MCGRYALIDIEELNDEYNIPEEFELSPNYNVAPTQTMPVITEDGIHLMRWGLIPAWAKDEKIGYKMINARSETVFEKPMWKGLITRKKCLIPANGFYEWQKRKDGKQPYYIFPKNKRLFMFAGIWEKWAHDGGEWYTYTILTTSANKEMEIIHDRMPVILEKEDYAQWLGSDKLDEINPLLKSLDDGSLKMYEVSKNVNMVKTNDKTLILPMNSK